MTERGDRTHSGEGVRGPLLPLWLVQLRGRRREVRGCFPGGLLHWCFPGGG